MGTRLVVCVHCDRHVRRSEHACPFCGKALPAQPKTGAAVVAASIVAVAMLGCGGAQPDPKPAPAYGPPPTEDPAPPADEADAVEDGVVPAPVPEEAETPPEEDEGRGMVTMYAPPPQ
jgi:hypothetical protein